QAALEAVDRRELTPDVARRDVLAGVTAGIAENLADEPGRLAALGSLQDDVERLLRILLDGLEQRVLDISLEVQLAAEPAGVVLDAARSCRRRHDAGGNDHRNDRTGTTAAAAPQSIRTSLAARASSPKCV